MKELPTNVSESVRRRNPHIYGSAVARLASTVEQQAPTQPLVKKLRRRQICTNRAWIIVTIVACRPQLIDMDNSSAPYKGLQDAICDELQIDDGDPAIKFEYGQCWSEHQGTIIKITIRP